MFDSLRRLYTKWLALPEVNGTEYENPIREMLRRLYYDSTESKIHEFRIGPSLREIGRLRAMGDGYASIIATLLSHKIAKLRRSRRGSESRFARTGVQ